MGYRLMKQSQKHISYFSFLGHRISGLLLAIFLPFHFLVLGMAIDHQNRLDTVLKWTDQPFVKFAEWGLVVLLALHFSFGLRLLLIEYTPWKGSRKNLIIMSLIFAFIVSSTFLIRAL